MKALLLCLVLSLAAPACLADCVAPGSSPEVPDGATAGRDAMLAALQAVKAYNAAVTTYVDCLRSTTHDTGRIDLALDHLTKVADKFNAELHTFKTRTGG